MEQCDSTSLSLSCSLPLSFTPLPYLSLASYHRQMEVTHVIIFPNSYGSYSLKLNPSISTDHLLQNFISQSHIIKQLKIRICPYDQNHREERCLPHSTPWRPAQRSLDQKRETPQQMSLKGHGSCCSSWLPQTKRWFSLHWQPWILISFESHSDINAVNKLKPLNWGQNKIGMELTDSCFSLRLIKQCPRDCQRRNRDVFLNLIVSKSI